ncbi:MAG: DUF494 domain-containing protein [Gammaproteobacteria bacterium]|nr:DUF494 domain-containing protein [Gammaproteobacteria bacterium]
MENEKYDLFDTLIYLFENYIQDDQDETAPHHFELLYDDLLKAGFRQSEIDAAFTWLEGLEELEAKAAAQQSVSCRSTSLRHYSEDEAAVLGVECRGFILFLEQMGVLNHHSRETVIERVMALQSDDFDLEQLKWVILMILFNQPGSEAASAWMEDIIIDETPVHLH